MTLEQLKSEAEKNQETWGFWPTWAFDESDWQDSLDYFEGDISGLIKYFARVSEMRKNKLSKE